MNNLTLDSVEWGEFFIGGVDGLFDVVGTKTTHPSILEEGGTIPRVTCAATNNAIDDFYLNEATEEGGVLTVDSATIGYVSYQSNDFIATDHVEKIVSKTGKINKYVGLFLKTSIDNSKIGKYGYGYKFSQKRIVRQKILLPIDSNGNPNWQFMEDYIKQEMKIQSRKIVAYYENKLTDLSFELLDLEVKWEQFKIKDIFEFKKKSSKGLNYLEKNDKGISYLGATNRNNGVLEFVKDDEKLKYKGNCIAFIRNGEGSMGYSVYKKEDFIATQDISVGYNDNLNLYTGTFITTIADRIRGKYNFGYKRNQNRLENETLHLPIDKNGEPNWEFMEDYIKQEMKVQSKKVVSYYENELMKLDFELLDLEVEWKEFKVKDLFEVKYVKGKSIRHYKEGKIPYITTSSVNNGLDSFIDTEHNISLKKCISIDPIGGKAFFHEYNFVGRGGAGSAINLLHNNALNKYSGLFICKMLESSSFSKASYGVQLNGNRLKNLKLLLPIDKNGEPYWEYMSNFVKKLEKENIG